MKHIFAALTFFTRLPFWRLGSVDKRYYKSVVPYWPYTGWLTGGIMCLTLWVAAQALPYFAGNHHGTHCKIARHRRTS